MPLKRKMAIVIGVMILSLGGWFIWDSLHPEEAQETESSLIGDEFELPRLNFKAVEGEYPWQFPADYDPHLDYQHEEWHLASTNCPIEFTIDFRLIRIIPANLPIQRSSNWAIESLLTGQVTLHEGERELVNQTIDSRVALDLAGAEEGRVWLGDWVLNWAESTFDYQYHDTGMHVNLDFAEALPQAETDWYSYERPVQVEGDIMLGTETRPINCSGILTHRFGTP
jgi:predicted secreted hydrolase